MASAAVATSASKAALRAATNPKDWTLAQTMLRIKDPKVAIPFFTEQLGFRLLQYVLLKRIRRSCLETRPTHNKS